MPNIKVGRWCSYYCPKSERSLRRAGGGQNNIKTHFQVFSGSSHSDLTNKVCDRLGIEPGKVGSW